MFFELLSTYTVALVLTLTIISLLLWRNTTRQEGLPPGPRLVPILGNALVLLNKDIASVHRKLRKVYGDIFCLYVGTKPFVVINGYKHLKEVFMTNGDVFSDRPVGLRVIEGESRGEPCIYT